MTSRGNGNSYEKKKSRSLEGKGSVGIDRIQYHVQLNLYYTSSQDISSTVKNKIKLAGYLYLTDDILFQLK